ncbi:MAG: hypothetical protein IIA99_03375 [Proteobacteria bacterium]|nr:hypothetical protein [Pseudomonadota bacterium]
MNIVLYGIKNRDTVKKDRRWLETHEIGYTFHDFRADGLDKEMIKEFLKQITLADITQCAIFYG